MIKYNDSDGVWRTIGGRRVFIKNGDDLATAMKKSGKFKNNKKDEEEKKKNESEEYLPKKVEIKEQGKSNRKEVSENIQAHILEYYEKPEDFIDQMDALSHLPNNWRRGEYLAEGGSYLIYNGDMSDFLDSLKINPKGKKFNEEKAFNMYKSLIGRESSKLYDRLKKRK